jgi:hypothetical protein
MNFKIACGARYISCPDISVIELERVFFLENPDFLRQNRKVLERLDIFRRKPLIRKPFFQSVINNIPDTNDVEQELRSQAVGVLNDINTFLLSLWFIRDHSVYGSDLIVWCENEMIVMPGSSFSYMSDSRQREVAFSQQDMLESRRIQGLILSLAKKTELSVPEELFGNTAALSNSIQYNDHTPIIRAILFLNRARGISHLPTRISFYAPIYECLFSSDADGITHKVAERAALYMGDDYPKSYETFDTVRDCYAMRSRVLHGGQLTSKQLPLKGQIKLSKDIDELTRRILFRVINTDSKFFNNEKSDIAKRFNNLIFSERSSSKYWKLDEG